MKINEDHDEAPIVSLNILSPDLTKTRPGDNHEANANTNKKPKNLPKCLPNRELQYSIQPAIPTGDKISEFSQNVTTNFDHVFVTSRGLKGFEDSFRRVT